MNGIEEKNVQEENSKLKSELEMLRIMMNELESTNNHLVAATWRERDLKKQLSDAIDEISKSKQLIEVQNRRIEESINYAERIQRSILPHEENIKALFSDSFMLFIPKDKVSGDFPFLCQRNDDIFISVVDCTGHGVPGALMSLVGHFVLNETFTEEIYTPAHLLDYLHEGVKRTLRQEANKDSRDGMDIALCKVNLEASLLEFSGAHRDLLLIRNGELMEYKGDKRPIGGTQYKNALPFSNHSIEIQKGDTIYIYSDGLPDQTGGPEKKKLMNIRVKELLLENNKFEMPVVKGELLREFEDWKGNTKQIDDVLLIGIRF